MCPYSAYQIYSEFNARYFLIDITHRFLGASTVDLFYSLAVVKGTPKTEKKTRNVDAIIIKSSFKGQRKKCMLMSIINALIIFQIHLEFNTNRECMYRVMLTLVQTDMQGIQRTTTTRGRPRTRVISGIEISARKGSPQICEMPKQVGQCRALLERYYYNYTLGTCKFFHYGGCGGNLNNFTTMKECKQTCE
uniref:BPTI/Kunitz inhibitor domain-containing protein n=1 Tax=Glossina brevipalpis TaxID=37001 RepID=A0A1A9W2Z5_9MUSC